MRNRFAETLALALRITAAGAVVALTSAAGCAASEGGEPCRFGSDCDSGICQDGTCLDALSSGAGASGGGATSTGSKSSGGGSDSSANGGSSGTGGASDGGSSGSGGSETCKPNHDGTITRAEVPLIAGVSAKFEAAENITFATSGTMTSGGKRDWNMVGPFSGDHLDLVETLDPSTQWFAADFAGATYAAKLSDSSDLLGVFEASADSLSLLGVVSPAGGVEKTELTYTPPVVVIAFPLTQGGSWSTDSTVTGYTDGIASAYTESYTQSVDASGTLETPFGTFPVLRVATVLTRTVGVVPTVIRSFAFVSECFGTVATVTSNDNETTTEFSSAAELLRLSP